MLDLIIQTRSKTDSREIPRNIPTNPPVSDRRVVAEYANTLVLMLIVFGILTFSKAVFDPNSSFSSSSVLSSFWPNLAVKIPQGYPHLYSALSNMAAKSSGTP